MALPMEREEEHSTMCTSKFTEFSKGPKKRPFQFGNKHSAIDDLTDKKRRLTLEQLSYLEMSFKMDVKLEPARKALIAKELGMRPRQVAIWFQNRRARWKNKQVEQDYETLRVNHDAVVKEKENLIKEYESALQDNKRLQAEVNRLTNLFHGEKDTDVSSVLSPMKEGQPSSNSGLMSPMKTRDNQSEIEDICVPPEECKVFITNEFLQDLNEMVACSRKVEGGCPLLVSSGNVFGNLPLLVQQLIANGHCFEDAYDIYLGCEYFGGGWR